MRNTHNAAESRVRCPELRSRAIIVQMVYFMEIVQAVKKLSLISRERLNFRRRPILCTTLYRNLMQASNFGGTFDQLFLRFFL